MKKIILLIYLFITFLGFSQENSIPKKMTQHGFGNIDFISVNMPNNEFNNPEENMGLTGLHYNLWLNKNFYTGLGFYGSVTGLRGGLFTLGINAGLKTNLTKKIFLDTGFHFGGGGGASAPDGGGAFILPHINFGYQFNNFSTTLGYSYINFFDKGNITSNQIRFGVQIPLNIDYTYFRNRQEKLSVNELKNSDWDQNTTNISLLMHLNNLSPYGGSKFTNGIVLDGKTIRLAGFEIAAYVSDNWFTFFKADGAYHGIRGGYMDIILGAGYHLALNKNRTNILAKFGIGAGGGGGVDTAGGLLIYPDISIEQKLFNNIFISVNKGYLMNPNQFFTSSTFGFGLKYYVNFQGIKTKTKSFKTSKIKGLEIAIGHDIYFNTQRHLIADTDLHQIAVQANMYVSKHWYLAGKTSFANFGDAGAYAEGIVGLGVKSESFLRNKVSVFAQGLIGAAGGGEVATGQGFIIKPSAGVYYNLNKKISLRSEAGYVKASSGNLSSVYFNFGLSYRIGFLTSH
ncbi:MAG: hypothetical protein HWD85_11200 [Flavobacteriaceae bacterium]|nr:hypothetical protein [Flavobacteriaceae bacterium]